MPDTPIIAQKAPYAVEVTSGKTYFWCACGRSQSQPLCDGSHQGTGIEPVAFQVEAEEESWFCMCKQTRDVPRCDGAHKSLPEDVDEFECPSQP